MKLRAIRLRNVKRFGDRGLALEGLSDGLNVLAAENEFGKSTIFQALRLGLFEKHSTKKQYILDMRPYQSTDGPSIELDIETHDGRYRLFKRFLTRASASVIDLGSGQTVARGADVHEWVQNRLGAGQEKDGPSGLFWVAQGASLHKPEPSKSTGAVLHSLLSQEVAHMTGGDRLKGVQAAARQRLRKIVTDGRGQPTGAYAKTKKEKAALVEQIAALSARQKEVEAAHRQLDEICAELATLRDPTSNTREQDALNAVTANWKTLDEAATTLRLEEQELQNLQVLEAQEKQALDALEQAQSDVTQNLTRQNALEAQRAALEQRIEKAQAHYLDAKQAEQTQRAWVSTARTAAQQYQIKDKLRSTEEELAQVKHNFVLAQEAEARRSAALKQAEGLPVTDAQLDELFQLQHAFVSAEAKCEAQAAQVTMTYNADATGRVRVDGEILENNQPHLIDDRVSLDLDGLGRMHIEFGREGSVRDARVARDKANQALADALKAVGASSVADAKANLDAKSKLIAAATAGARERDLHAPEGLDELKSKIEGLEERVRTVGGQLMQPVSASPTPADLEVGEAKLSADKDALTAAERGLSELESERKVVDAQRDAVKSAVEELVQRYGSQDDMRQKKDALTTKRSALIEKIKAKREAINDLQSRAKDLMAVKEQKAALEQQQMARLKREQELENQSARLEGRVLADGASGLGEAVLKARDALDIVDRKVAQFEQDHAALEMLVQALEHAEQSAQDQFLEPVLAELRPLLHAVMPQAEVRFTSDFALDVLARDGMHEPFDNLSGGTREQIAILSRLAFARLMARRGRDMPVILDDALVYSDDARITEMFKALQTAADDIQLIVLSCRQNTFRALGGARIEPSAWLDQAA